MTFLQAHSACQKPHCKPVETRTSVRVLRGQLGTGCSSLRLVMAGALVRPLPHLSGPPARQTLSTSSAVLLLPGLRGLPWLLAGPPSLAVPWESPPWKSGLQSHTTRAAWAWAQPVLSPPAAEAGRAFHTSGGPLLLHTTASTAAAELLCSHHVSLPSSLQGHPSPSRALPCSLVKGHQALGTAFWGLQPPPTALQVQSLLSTSGRCRQCCL